MTKLKRAVLIFPLILLLLGGMWVWASLHTHGAFPIKEVNIEGHLTYTSKEVMQETVAPLIEAGFFNLDVEDVKEALIILPAIAEVKVRRGWPDRLDISITEHEVIARWKDEAWLTPAGSLFSTDVEMPEGLPEFFALTEDIPNLLALYTTWKRVFGEHSHTINRISRVGVNSWSIMMDDKEHIVFLETQTDTALREFLEHYTELLAQFPDKRFNHIDLRYHNGFAAH